MLAIIILYDNHSLSEKSIAIFMEQLTRNQVSSQTLDHLGLVAATIHDLRLIERIDKLLPLNMDKGVNLTIGQRVASMILTGLGFIDTRLYMFAEYLQDKPLERLIGAGVKAEDFTDDSLGRGLDRIHGYGVERFFGELSYDIALQEGFLGKFSHTDTTSLSLEGAYNYTPDEIPQPVEGALPTPEVTYGYSKAHRPDLKQVILSLATTGAASFPIWMESHSGNASDQKTLIETAGRMEAFSASLKTHSNGFLYVADSAMYSGCLKQSGDLLWLSRVPERVKHAKDLLSLADDAFIWKDQGNGYKVCQIGVNYKVKQSWCLVYSEQAFKREMITFERNLAKAQEESSKAFWHLSCKEFGCEDDAQKAAKKLSSGWRYYQLKFEVEAVKKYNKAGRPKATEAADLVIYKLKGEVVANEVAIELMKRRKGRFIIATNDVEEKKVSEDELLSSYKSQSGTEGGFKFLKDDSFQVSSVFLEKPSRISALMAVMVLCLMVYNVAQYRLREALKVNDETIPDQKGKKTDTPTLKRVFKLFLGIQLLLIQSADLEQSIVINLNEVIIRIIKLYGYKAMEIYGISNRVEQKTTNG